jgi:hypothetical protein
MTQKIKSTKKVKKVNNSEKINEIELNLIDDVVEKNLELSFIIEKFRNCDLLEPFVLDRLNEIGSLGYELKTSCESYIDLQKYQIFIFTKISNK